MPYPLLPLWKKIARPVIGMIHLLPLPGSPQHLEEEDLVDHAIRQAEALTEGGVDGLMIENYNDVPFYPGPVPAHVVAWMTALASEVLRKTHLPVGINVLRNDAMAALAVAAASGASFIRVNVLAGARVTDQGVIQGVAHDLLRERRRIGAMRVRILADVDVKHSAPLGARDIQEEARDAVERGLADGLIVTGAGTGRETDAAKLAKVRKATPLTPVFVGSGVTPKNLSKMKNANGFIVGTWFKTGERFGGSVDIARVKELMRRVKGE